MSRYTGPKNRIARKFGINIFGKLRNPLLHRLHPPGMHGAKRKKKSDFGVQLEEQQKLKASYGMLTQKQLLKAYRKALKIPGKTADNLLHVLECRLDNIVYRLRLTSTIFGAQQLVAHGHILVDGKKMDRRSFHVLPGMTISLKPKSQKMKAIKEAIDNTSREIPLYLTLSEDRFSGTLTAVPEYDQIPLPLLINIPLVCEFLAHTS